MSMPFQQDESAFNIIKPEENQFTKRQIKGNEYLLILDKITRITYYQQLYGIKNGIKGFIFHGDVGIGKTTLAKTMAHEVGAPLIFIDGSDIARPLYGQSESQVSNVFDEAKKYKYAILLIDDCESVFPSRDWMKAESWHIAQNNVFFHELDNIDTSKITVILTTNRYDLLDKAVKDRLHNIEFPLPSKDVLIEIAKFKCTQLKMNNEFAIKEIEKGNIKSIRQLERVIMGEYVEWIIKNDFNE